MASSTIKRPGNVYVSDDSLHAPLQLKSLYSWTDKLAFGNSSNTMTIAVGDASVVFSASGIVITDAQGNTKTIS